MTKKLLLPLAFVLAVLGLTAVSSHELGIVLKGNALTIDRANGTQVTGIYSITETYDVPSLTTGLCDSTQTATMTGAATGDSCVLTDDGQANLNGRCWIGAANTVYYRFCNDGGSTVDPGSKTYRLTAFAF